MADKYEIRLFKLGEGVAQERIGESDKWIVRGGEVEISDEFSPEYDKDNVGVVFLKKPDGITVSSKCVCSAGGSCDTLIIVDGETGKKRMRCESNTCTGGCGIEITLPPGGGVLAPA